MGFEQGKNEFLSSTVPFCLSVPGYPMSAVWGAQMCFYLSLYLSREVLNTEGEGLSLWTHEESRVTTEIIQNVINSNRKPVKGHVNEDMTR